MPSSVTHAFFALDVYDKMPKDIQNKLKHNIGHLKLFSEGSDSLNFYNLANLKKGKFIRDNYPKLIHTKNIQKLFVTMTNYIKDNKLQKKPEIMSFLYGFICHYTLDVATHPFIIYKTGVYEKDNPNTYKYNGLHNDMEVYIDAYFIYQRLKVMPKDFKMYNFIFETDTFSEDLKKLLNNVFKEVYDIDNFSEIYITSIKQMKNIFRLFRYDKLGIKKIGYKFLDKILPKSQLKKEMLSYNVHHKKKIHYLNLEKNEWNHPCYPNEIYNYSFIELYRIALSKAVHTLNEVNKYLYDDAKVNLYEIFEDVSSVTGKSCDDCEKCQYFEF